MLPSVLHDASGAGASKGAAIDVLAAEAHSAGSKTNRSRQRLLHRATEQIDTERHTESIQTAC